MSTHAAQSPENKTPTHSKAVARKQGETEPASHFQDHRPRTFQLQHLQNIAHTNPRTRQALQLQARMQQHTMETALQANKEDEEEIPSIATGKPKNERAWKPVQLKKKTSPIINPHEPQNIKDAPIQGKWMNRMEGPKWGLLKWVQTEEDVKNGYYLEDGWYKAKLDFRTYWAIKLRDTEIDDILTGREMVWVRPWLVTMSYPSGKSASPHGPDYSFVFHTIREIWKQAHIGIQIDTPVQQTVAMSKELEAYESKEELVAELNDKLRGNINNHIGFDARRQREGIQAVFVPSYDRWGFTYHMGSAGYNGPVTFVTTSTAGIGKGLVTREQQSPSGFIDTAVSLDAAHEIGHAFGLQHVMRADEVQLLMHEVLYNSFLNAEKQPDESTALQIAHKTFSKYEMPMIFKRSKEGVQYWAVLHGSKFTEKQIETVLDNVIGKKLWR